MKEKVLISDISQELCSVSVWSSIWPFDCVIDIELWLTLTMSDTESSSSDNFEDAVESVEIAQSPTSKAKRNTMKRGVTSADVAAAGARSEHQLSPEIEDQIEILTGENMKIAE